MATCAKFPIPRLPAPAYSAKRIKKMKTMEEKRELKKRLNKKRDQTRVYIGKAFSRWRQLRERYGLKSDEEVAMFLLDSYDQHCLTSTTRKRGSTHKLPAQPASGIYCSFSVIGPTS
ncbi:uncharacterized protein LOC144464117 [Epinephelus lanceolatus]